MAPSAWLVLGREGDFPQLIGRLLLSKEAQDEREYRLESAGAEAFLKRWIKATNEKMTDEMIEGDFHNFMTDLRWQLIKDRIVRDNELKITEDDVRALAKEMADKIAAAIISADSANADYYASNVRKLSDKLLNLDREYSQGLSSCARKDIVTSHDAFGYMASAYGLNQVSVAGLSPDAEPSPKEIASVAKFAKDNGIKYIFFESLISPKLAETIATEIGAETMVLNPLEGLSEDEIEQGKDYVTEMRANLANLEKALQCKK